MGESGCEGGSDLNRLNDSHPLDDLDSGHPSFVSVRAAIKVAALSVNELLFFRVSS